ncbi:MAG TPA: PPC domain-containing protein [Blastocatellia bacterium]|nr:PPC domain-containing protein [Blastocatellia bacterium]
MRASHVHPGHIPSSHRFLVPGAGMMVLALLLFCPAQGPRAAVSSSNGLNNSRATALPLTLPASATIEVRGTIDRADRVTGEVFDATDFGLEGGFDDIEWFGRFTLDRPDLVSAILSILTSGGDLDLYLLTGEGRVVQSSFGVNNPEGWDPGILLEAGTYFVGISNYDGDAATSPGPGTSFVLTLTRGGNRQLLALDNGLPIDRYFATAPGRIVLNRFVPVGYPFRLERVLILFFRRSQSEPSPVGQLIRLLVLHDPSGGRVPPVLGHATVLVDRTETVQESGSFSVYPVSLPVITQGVLYIGFQIPATVPRNTLSIWADGYGLDRRQSFTSTDQGESWSVVPLHSFFIRAEGTHLTESLGRLTSVKVF